MTFFQTDPLNDVRWPALLVRHPRASIFHTQEWLQALRSTHDYEPVVLTNSAPDDECLRNGMVFCRINSWLTGRRVVSLPFSDHCEPLVETAKELRDMLSYLRGDLAQRKARYFEFRPVTPSEHVSDGLEKSGSFCLHQLDLRPTLDDLFQRLHKDCVQRKIRRAQRESLTYEEGNSKTLLKRFYRLLILTRRRHQLAPQPFAWFRNMAALMGDKLKIRLASKDGHPIASILTLRYKHNMVYKNGCSDVRFHNLGGMQLLLWKSIEEAKQTGLGWFDLGRSDWENSGLVAFKDRWGAQRSVLTYLRVPGSSQPTTAKEPGRLSWKQQLARRVLPRLPDRALSVTGSLIYRHLG